jgi:hypothetical protein
MSAGRMPVEGALPYIVERARDEGRLGLVVVLARAAEAPGLHEELVRDWASICDVAGEAMAVLCPGAWSGPDGRGGPAARARSTGEVLSGSGPGDGGLPGYGALWPSRGGAGYGTEPTWGQAEWTAAVSHCTRYFGVPEERLPALLVLCLHDEQDVLVQLDGKTGVYELCKQISARSGRLLHDRGLFEERDRLGNRIAWLQRTVDSRERERRTSAWPMPDDPGLERDREELAEDRARLRELERRLAARRGLAATTVEAARAVLGDDAETGTLPQGGTGPGADPPGTPSWGADAQGTEQPGFGAGYASEAGGRRMLTVRPAARPAAEGSARDAGAGDAGSRADVKSPGGVHVRNSISGATIYGTVVQGGDMGSVTIQPPPDGGPGHRAS